MNTVKEANNKTYINLNKERKKHIVLRNPGTYVAYVVNSSGEYIFELRAEGINLEIYGLFWGKDKDDYKLHTVQHHIAPNSTSNLLIKGVFNDESKFHYTGLVKIEKKAQKSHAYQKNQNLILSPGVFVESEPFLEIEANDVFCTHGSTTGKLNEEELRYIMSRGITRGDAQDLMVDGFMQQVVSQLPEGAALTHKTLG